MAASKPRNSFSPRAYLSPAIAGQKDRIGHNDNAESNPASGGANETVFPNASPLLTDSLALSLAQRARLTFKRIFVEFSPRGISNPGECRHLLQATQQGGSWWSRDRGNVRETGNLPSNNPVNLNSHIKGKGKIQVEAAII